MKKPSIFLFWLWLCFLGQAGAISTIEDKTFEVSSLSVAIKNINDVGLVFVRHDKGKVNIASLASWAGIAGSDETELDKYMDEGDNLLIFVLWNKQGKAIDVPYINFKKSFLDSWSFEFSLFGDGTNLFHQAQEGKGGNGVAHFEAFNVEKSGQIYRVSPASMLQIGAIHQALDRINEDLKRYPIPENDSDIATFVSVAFGN
jgi:hypothetical protein